MKSKSFQLIILIVVLLSGSFLYGQGSLGVGPKKPRTVADYKPSTVKELLAADPQRDELLPFRVRVVYTASVRPISKTNNDVLHGWAQCCAGSPDHYTRAYLNEMRVTENGTAYWLAVQERLLADFPAELKIGEVMDLFLIRVSALKTNGKRGSVLLVERVEKLGKSNDQIKESLNWIRSNLPSYAEKDLKVDIPEPCRLVITDSSNSPSLSKAVVFLPISDLDPTKVSLLPRPSSIAWDLWLHTTSGKSSIVFMLYQGGPAEGGQANKYSLTLRDREKAEAMAETLRGAIRLCAGASAPRQPINGRLRKGVDRGRDRGR